MNLITDAKKIATAIASIKGRGTKLDADIQHAALSVLQHCANTGDTTLADKLVQAMPKGGRALALVEWMLAFGTIRKLDAKSKDEKKAIEAGRIFQDDKKNRTLDLAGAQAKQWHEFRKEAAISTAFDAQASTKRLLAALQNAAAQGMTVEGKAEAAANLRAALEVLEAGNE